jgi:hypothetical protein
MNGVIGRRPRRFSTPEFRFVPNSDQQLPPASSPVRGQLPIALGLALLITAGWLPGIPELTAMSLVALGTTLAMIDRYGRHPAFRLLLIAHLTIYVALYLLFLGAVEHRSLMNQGASWGLVHSLDLAISAGMMAAAVRNSLAALRRRFCGPNATRT